MQVKVIRKPNADTVWRLHSATVQFTDEGQVLINLGLIRWTNETDFVNRDQHEQFINVDLVSSDINVDAWRTAIINAIKNRFAGFSEFYEDEITLPDPVIE